MEFTHKNTQGPMKEKNRHNKSKQAHRTVGEPIEKSP